MQYQSKKILITDGEKDVILEQNKLYIICIYYDENNHYFIGRFENKTKLNDLAFDLSYRFHERRLEVGPDRILHVEEFSECSTNLCDLCRCDFGGCLPDNTKFGCGKGNDNVIECDWFDFNQNWEEPR